MNLLNNDLLNYFPKSFKVDILNEDEDEMYTLAHTIVIGATKFASEATGIDFEDFDEQREDAIEFALDRIREDNTQKEISYVLGENSINGTTLNEKIRDEELHEYYIIDRKDFIDDLIRWIGEANSSDKILMMEDLEELLTWEDEYILSSNSTNAYIGKHSNNFDETCKELLALNDSIE